MRLRERKSRRGWLRSILISAAFSNTPFFKYSMQIRVRLKIHTSDANSTLASLRFDHRIVYSDRGRLADTGQGPARRMSVATNVRLCLHCRLTFSYFSHDFYKPHFNAPLIGLDHSWNQYDSRRFLCPTSAYKHDLMDVIWKNWFPFEKLIVFNLLRKVRSVFFKRPFWM